MNIDALISLARVVAWPVCILSLIFFVITVIGKIQQESDPHAEMRTFVQLYLHGHARVAVIRWGYLWSAILSALTIALTWPK